MSAHDHDTHSHEPHGSDAKAAFLGLIIGAIVLFGIITTIIKLTNARYAHERPAASGAPTPR
jgi:hypothetical protein